MDDGTERGGSFLDALAEKALLARQTGSPESTQSEANGAGDIQAQAKSDEASVARLAALPPMQYDRARKAEARKLGVNVTTLDSMVKAARGSDEESNQPFTDVEPWHDPISPAALLNEVAHTVSRFIVLESAQADAAALWVAFTHFIDVVDVAPLAVVNAPEKACGKSQLLTVFGRLVAKPLPAANSSAAFLFRAIELWMPTVLIDETDTFIRDNEELKGLVNAGHTRQNATVGRVVGEDLTPKLFKVWGAKAMAGIALEKHLPDATISRAIVFNMRRKLPNEKVERLRHAEPKLFDTLQAKLARFAEDYSEQVRRARPALPEELSDRAQDNWEPLLAIAQCAGPEWLERAEKAALLLSGVAESTQSTGNELLADIQHVFERKGVQRISTAELITGLIEDDEAAWATYNRGRELSPRQLSKMLKGYGIQSKNVRFPYEQAKGFELEQFEDAFSRYLSTPASPPDLSVTPVPKPSNPINMRRDMVRMEKSGTEDKIQAVPPEPSWIKAKDGGTEESPFLEGAAGIESEVEF